MIGEILVLATQASKVMDDATTTTDIHGRPLAPPRPACGIGEKAIYKSDQNKWFCVPKAFG